MLHSFLPYLITSPSYKFFSYLTQWVYLSNSCNMEAFACTRKKFVVAKKTFSQKWKGWENPAPRMGFFMPEICEIKSFLTRCHNFSFLFSRGTKNTRERDKNVNEVAFNKILQLMKNFQGVDTKNICKSFKFILNFYTKINFYLL